MTPRCTCEEGSGPKALVKTTAMKDQPRTEANTMIQCAHCDKILKYYGTIEFTNPATGERGYRTVLL